MAVAACLAPSLGSSGCATGAAHGSAWRELSSPHFLLRTDVNSPSARAALVQFEETYGAFEGLAFPGTRPTRSRIEVVLFADEQDFRSVAPAGAAGYFMPHQANDVEYTPTIAMHGESSPSSRRRFQHELAHRFLSAQVRDAPPWIEEGLAEYYSTLRPAGDGSADALIVGEMDVARVFTTELHSFMSLAERYVEYRVAVDELPSVRELIGAGDARFHQPDTEPAWYAASWALVHLLDGSPRWHSRFSTLLDDLRAGVPSDAAWAARFGDVDLDALGAELHHYVQRVELPSRRVRFIAPSPSLTASATEPERPMPAGAVHLLRARVRPWDSRESIVRSGQDLSSAVAAASGDPELQAEIRYWMALYQRRWRHFGAAEGSLRSAIALRPDEDRYWHALAALLVEEGDARVAEVVRVLVGVARSPHALDFVARWLIARGDVEAALSYARRAVEAEPSCWECTDTFAALSRSGAAHAPSTNSGERRSIDYGEWL